LEEKNDFINCHPLYSRVSMDVRDETSPAPKKTNADIKEIEQYDYQQDGSYP
jgi:hypothetical protein